MLDGLYFITKLIISIILCISSIITTVLVCWLVIISLIIHLNSLLDMRKETIDQKKKKQTINE